MLFRSPGLRMGNWCVGVGQKGVCCVGDKGHDLCSGCGISSYCGVAVVVLVVLVVAVLLSLGTVS